MTAAAPTPGVSRVLVALGGNAMSAPDGSATEDDQTAALGQAAAHIADLVAEGVDVVITHGNGPQVGNLLATNEYALAIAPPASLAWCDAQTQATIGLTLMNALDGELAARGCRRPVVSLITRTLVDAEDPAFGDPVKPIGRYRPVAEARRFVGLGQTWKDYGARGWRRVVASPRPLEVLEAPTARSLADSGVVVVCAGGGGIPVVRRGARLENVEAVIDKDLASAVLAPVVGADTLILATDVEAAMIGYGGPDPERIGHVGLRRIRELEAQGHFAAGSMGPKVGAARSFVENGGRAAIITRVDLLAEAARRAVGEVGTVITAAGPAA
ncbi:carbamate kinase [Cumulibacter manganitolerans]|uniref:carbamate kinase n=1 Tax=Cumulibacter manganitolerans TaxID=1884992 RepID=UPI0012967EB6|nr:carbamate kinase [Cumulibacter manganitolerans]